MSIFRKLIDCSVCPEGLSGAISIHSAFAHVLRPRCPTATEKGSKDRTVRQPQILHTWATTSLPLRLTATRSSLKRGPQSSPPESSRDDPYDGFQSHYGGGLGYPNKWDSATDEFHFSKKRQRGDSMSSYHGSYPRPSNMGLGLYGYNSSAGPSQRLYSGPGHGPAQGHPFGMGMPGSHSSSQHYQSSTPFQFGVGAPAHRFSFGEGSHSQRYGARPQHADTYGAGSSFNSSPVSIQTPASNTLPSQGGNGYLMGDYGMHSTSTSSQGIPQLGDEDLKIQTQASLNLSHSGPSNTFDSLDIPTQSTFPTTMPSATYSSTAYSGLPQRPSTASQTSIYQTSGSLAAGSVLNSGSWLGTDNLDEHPAPGYSNQPP
jgi:hypothetical protein